MFGQGSPVKLLRTMRTVDLWLVLPLMVGPVPPSIKLDSTITTNKQLDFMDLVSVLFQHFKLLHTTGHCSHWYGPSPSTFSLTMFITLVWSSTSILAFYVMTMYYFDIISEDCERKLNNMSLFYSSYIQKRLPSLTVRAQQTRLC